MVRLIIPLCILLVFSSCATGSPVPADQPGVSSPGVQPEAVDSPGIAESAGEEPDDPEESGREGETVFIRDSDMDIEDIVEAYFEQMYLSYINLDYIDISCLLDMTNSANRNKLQWLQMLIQRRRLLFDHGLCYVETDQFPYSIEYSAEPEDDRMELWQDWLNETGNEVIHFNVGGEAGKAYPPIMAVNSQHTIFFKEIDGELKITLHYFPGSVRKFSRAGTIKAPSEDDMLEQLMDEFAEINFTDEPAPLSGSMPYDAERAVLYAREYTETPNPDFYIIGDWIGNCANFISQCVWAGFGGKIMTPEWYGGDGGTIAWENVNYFWDYITGGSRLGGVLLESARELSDGDIIQTRTATIIGEENRFTHIVMVVDDEKMVLAQNTPASFVYYSDLVNVETRMIRPTYLI